MSLSFAYAAVKFLRTHDIDLDNRVDKEYFVYKSAYQTVTGNYDFDFILKLIVYYLFILSWQMPFLHMMWPRLKLAQKKTRFAIPDPRDATRTISINTSHEDDSRYTDYTKSGLMDSVLRSQYDDEESENEAMQIATGSMPTTPLTFQYQDKRGEISRQMRELMMAKANVNVRIVA